MAKSRFYANKNLKHIYEISLYDVKHEVYVMP